MQEDFISYSWISLLGKDCGGTKWRLNGEEEMCASWKRGEGVKAEIQTKEKTTHKSTFSTFSPKNGCHIILIGNKMQIRKETWRCLDYSFFSPSSQKCFSSYSYNWMMYVWNYEAVFTFDAKSANFLCPSWRSDFLRRAYEQGLLRRKLFKSQSCVSIQHIKFWCVNLMHLVHKHWEWSWQGDICCLVGKL